MLIKTKIVTLDDVKAFAKHLVQIDNVSFHPDDDFKDYVTSDNQQCYSEEEALQRNQLMDDCFAVCESLNIDIYEIMTPIIQEATLIAEHT